MLKRIELILTEDEYYDMMVMLEDCADNPLQNNVVAELILKKIEGD